QVISRLTNVDDLIKYVIQLPMGFGKTTILGPLLAYRAAKSGRLPFFIVPKELHEELNRELVNTSHALLKQWFVELDWTVTTKERLQALLDKLQCVHQVKGFVTCSDTDLYQFVAHQIALTLKLQNPEQYTKEFLKESQETLELYRACTAFLKR